MKAIVLNANVPPLQKIGVLCGPCKKNFEHIVNIHSFQSIKVVYLFTCKTSSKKYTVSTEDFQPRLNNYTCARRNFLKRIIVKQESFYAHFAEVNHNGEDD